MGFIYIILSAVILFFLVKNKSNSRRIYAAVGFIISFIFIFRFACDNISCISNVFFGDINSRCANVCNECNYFETENISLLGFIENDFFCSSCNKCEADWNIRAAFDSSGIIFLGILLLLCFLYRKNYPLKAFLRGLDTINLFGVLSFKVSEIEKTVDELTDEIKSELTDEDIHKKASEINLIIHQSSKSPFDTLHLFIEKLEIEYTKIDKIIRQKHPIISLQKEKQFERLSKAIKSLIDFVKRDWTNKYINRAIVIAKRILILLYNLLDYIQNPDSSSVVKYVRKDMGVDTTGDKYSVIIKRRTNIPTKKTRNYTTKEDNQRSIKSMIYFGNNLIASENELIGDITLTGIPPLKAGEAKNTIQFKIDKAGTLIVKQTCRETNKVVQKDFKVNEYLGTEDKPNINGKN